MTEQPQAQHAGTPMTEPTPLDLPAERLREPSSDELPVELADAEEVLPLDDSDREREEAGLLKK